MLLAGRGARIVFGFGRKWARETAARLGKAMVVARDACHSGDLQGVLNVMDGHDFTRVKVDSSNNGPVAAWV
jgi:hypothetical protein